MSKAANLELMKQVGIRVPDFVNIAGNVNESEFYSQIASRYDRYAVRSSGSVSTPGRMDTILDVKYENLYKAYTRVKNSANSSSVKNYLKAKNITHFEQSVVVQMLVPVGKEDCAGVLTTIHPVTQKEELYGNIVYGQHADKLMRGLQNTGGLACIAGKGYESLVEQVAMVLELMQTPQEIEFVIRDNVAYIVQTRDFKELTITPQLPVEIRNVVGFGQSVTPFTTIGVVTRDMNNCKDKILLAETTDFEDTETLINCRGIITENGGTLSHAALIAREFSIPCIVGATFNTEVEGMTVILHSNGNIERK